MHATSQSFRPVLSLTLLLLAVLALAACSPTPIAAPTAEASPTAMPTDTAVPTATATSTPEPTATATATTVPTATNTPVPPLAAVPEEFSGWCLPLEFAFPYQVNAAVGTAPAGARVATMVDGQLNAQIPAYACTLVFAFNQAVPAGTVYEMYYEASPAEPWLRAELLPVEGSPNRGYVTLTHEFVINPPFWEVTHPVKLRAADGGELWSGPVRFFKALPNLCWNGTIPDPVTLACPSTDGDWNYNDFPNLNPNADVFNHQEPPPGKEE